MKYFFIINPSSGANKSKDHLLDEIVSLKSEGYDVLYHFTKLTSLNTDMLLT